MSFDTAQFITDRQALHCRECNPEMAGPAREFRVYLGETTWPKGGRRAVAVFVCVACGVYRYLDLATEPPKERA